MAYTKVDSLTQCSIDGQGWPEREGGPNEGIFKTKSKLDGHLPAINMLRLVDIVDDEVITLHDSEKKANALEVILQPPVMKNRRRLNAA